VTRMAGTGTLLALALRRDRWMLPAWVATFAAVVGFSAAASDDLYTDTAEVVRVSEGWNTTTALVALHGRIYDPGSLGSATLAKPMGIGTAMVALLAMLLVVRHTRADEEVGRTELAAGGVVGQYAALAAALLVSIGTVTALSLASAATLLATGLPTTGSLAFAAAWTGAGISFALVGAVAAQLARTARAARGLGAAALAVAYVVRALGDTQPADGARWLTWFSPVGWAQQVRPFAGDRWWATVPPLLGAVAGLVLALVLLSRRDLGAGLIVDRPGPDSGPGLVSIGALAWRIQRLALVGWLVGTVVLGTALGSIASTIDDLLDNERFRFYIELLGGVSVLEDAFLSAELGIAAVAVSAYGIGAAQRMRSEESQGRAEPLFAAGVSRTAYAVSHLVAALAGTALLLLAAGLSIGAAHALATGDPGQVGRLVAAALVRLPAVWVMTATVMAFYGVAGRLTALAWVLLVGVLVVGEFGPLMDLPAWTLDLSPFAHVPPLPGGDFEAGALLWLTLIAAALAAFGILAFRRRDLQPD
jgi:ABC-2 type transport system permease protein